MFDYFNSQVGKKFNAIKISIASPNKIRLWSHGEVKKPDTVNYRTIKPENEGLFCARIFGPVRDYECICGKYKRIKYKGTVCEKCGVEVTTSKVRRERMGHIELATPVIHIWFLRSLPSKISILLDISLKKIEKVLYYDSYIVSDPGITSFKRGELISEEVYHNNMDVYGKNSFKAGIGAEAIKELLININLNKERIKLRHELLEIKSEINKKKLIKRLKLIENFLESGNKIEWMILTVLPVIPPDLRPLVMLDGGRFATSDLNELYRRVINRNNRLQRLIELQAPNVIVRNEKRMLQESVDCLFDNNKKHKTAKASNKRPLKSLSDMLKGKYGRFRQNLLGKRVDYSGRSVIVVGSELRLNQCGIPKTMALELMKPFVYSKLALYGIASNIKEAKKFVEQTKIEVWDILEEVIKEHPVFLNRAPTLHKLGIQAFEAKLIEGKAIQLHPLVCSAFNADFDGDQMAVHVPLSIEAQLEARILMMATNNILNSSNGEAIIVPSQDIVLGIYYLSLSFENQKGENILFSSLSELKLAIELKKISIHAKIKYRILLYKLEKYYSKIISITPGRLLIAGIIPGEFGKINYSYFNKVMNKKTISKLVEIVYLYSGQNETIVFVDKLMRLGFDYACKSGISISKDDIIIPKTKKMHVDFTLREIRKYQEQYDNGLITFSEKYNKSIDSWNKCGDIIASDMIKYLVNNNNDKKKHINFTSLNSIYIMSDSGARGSSAQMRQLAGMRGLMTKPSGEIIETPIISNFKEGLNELEYFISTHGARKGLADTALKTANSGYLTRKLVDVAQDCIINEKECKTEDGIYIYRNSEESNKEISIRELLLGRILIEDIYINKKRNILLLKKGTFINENIISIIEKNKIEQVRIRSPLFCQSDSGICSKCYGKDLSTNNMVNLGEAVGIIAAQSIGEPGTQLTMRTFHIGGAAQKINTQSDIIATCSGYIFFNNAFVIQDKNGIKINMSKNCEIIIFNTKDRKKIISKIPHGAEIKKEEGQIVNLGETIAIWDPFTFPILSEISGVLYFVDFRDSIKINNIKNRTEETTDKIILDRLKETNESNSKPYIFLKHKNKIINFNNKEELKYFLPYNSIVNVKSGQKVNLGEMLFKIPKKSSKNRDITGGLPRVVELFEARSSKDAAILSEIDGYIEYGEEYKTKKKLVIKSKKKERSEYFIPKNQYIAFNEGDYISKGEILLGGNPSPHDILRILGKEKFATYMIDEIQQIYKSQGVEINNKHIEIILRQMLRKTEIISPGDTIFLSGEKIDIEYLRKINKKAISEKYKPAISKVVLQGITKSSLQTESFLSAASFQETIKVLTEAAISSKIDFLEGLKENVIVGRIIPAGTGFYLNKIKEKIQ